MRTDDEIKGLVGIQVHIHDVDHVISQRRKQIGRAIAGVGQAAQEFRQHNGWRNVENAQGLPRRIIQQVHGKQRVKPVPVRGLAFRATVLTDVQGFEIVHAVEHVQTVKNFQMTSVHRVEIRKSAGADRTRSH